MHTVVARLNGEGAAGHGHIRVGMNCVVACIQREGTARDIQRRLDPRFFGTVSGRLQALTAVFIREGIVPHAVALPGANIKGASVDIQRGVRLDAVAVYIDVKGTAVDGDGARRLGVDHRSFCLIGRVGCAPDAVVRGFDDVGTLIDDDTAVTADTVVDRSARGGRAVIFRVAADIDRTALIKNQLGRRAALDTVLRVGDDIQVSVAAEGHRRAALDLDRRALKGFGYGRIGGGLVRGILVIGEGRSAN